MKHNRTKLCSIFNDRYGKLIESIIDCDKYNQFNMDHIYNLIHKDRSLSDFKKRRFDKFYEAFQSAYCIESPCMEFVNFLRKTDYNLEKSLDNMEEIIYPLYGIYKNLGLEKYLNYHYIPIAVMNIMISYGYYTRPRPILNTKGCNHGDLILSLLGLYSKQIAMNDYPRMWLVISFIKNLSLLASSTQYDLANNDKLEVIANNIFNLLDFVLNDTIVKNVEGVIE